MRMLFGESIWATRRCGGNSVQRHTRGRHMATKIELGRQMEPQDLRNHSLQNFLLTVLIPVGNPYCLTKRISTSGKSEKKAYHEAYRPPIKSPSIWIPKTSHQTTRAQNPKKKDRYLSNQP